MHLTHARWSMVFRTIVLIGGLCLACGRLELNSREGLGYPTVDATSTYDSIGVYLINTSGAPLPVSMRDSVEAHLIGCLRQNGFRVAAYRAGRDIDKTRWRTQADLDDRAASSIATGYATEATMLVQVLFYQPPTAAKAGRVAFVNPNTGVTQPSDPGSPASDASITFDARLVDGPSSKVVWARKVTSPSGQGAACRALSTVHARQAGRGQGAPD